MPCFVENSELPSDNTSPVSRRVLGGAGLLYIILNLLGMLFPGVDIAMHGIFSTQPLYNLSLPLRLLPLAAFVLGVIAGGGLLARSPWARPLTIYYTVLLALAAPLWAQQLCLGFFIYTSQQPQVLLVLMICLASLALVVAAIVIMRRPEVQSAYTPSTPLGRPSFPWLFTVMAVIIAGTHFALTMYVQHSIIAQPAQNGVPPPPLPPVAEVAFYFTHMLPSSLTQTVFPLPLFIAQSSIVGLLLTLLAMLIIRNPLSKRMVLRNTWNRVIIWQLAGVTALVSLVILYCMLLMRLLTGFQELRIVGSDYAMKTRRIAALRKYGPDIVAPSSGAITDAAYDLYQFVGFIGPSGFEYHIALQVAPGDITGWTQHWELDNG